MKILEDGFWYTDVVVQEPWEIMVLSPLQALLHQFDVLDSFVHQETKNFSYRCQVGVGWRPGITFLLLAWSGGTNFHGHYQLSTRSRGSLSLFGSYGST